MSRRHRPHRSFGVLAGDPEATYWDFALALGGEFGWFEPSILEGALTGLAARLACPPTAKPIDQLRDAGHVLGARLQALPDDGPPADLLVPRVAVHGRGHALACALVAIEAAARSGTALALLTSHRTVLVGSPALTRPVVLWPAQGWSLVDVSDVADADLHWTCAHEAAAQWLDLLRERSFAHGDRAVAMRALELRLALPLDGGGQEELRRFHDQLVGLPA